MDIGGLAMRDIILVLAGLAGIYLVLTVLRLVQVGRHKPAVLDDSLHVPEIDAEPAIDTAPVEPELPPLEAPPPVSGFGAELLRSHQDQEVRRLHDEIAQLREELAVLREELVYIKAARNISPQYADAMSLAQRGLTAQDVADRCGISLGEAELVWALSRGANNLEYEDDYGGDSGRKHARAA